MSSVCVRVTWLAARSSECSNALLLKQQQTASPQVSVLQRAAWQPWSTGLKALMFQRGQLLPEEDNLMSPLPMRQLSSSNASLAAKSGTKRLAPAATDPGETPCHMLQSVLLSSHLRFWQECSSALPHEFSWLSCACSQSG